MKKLMIVMGLSIGIVFGGSVKVEGTNTRYTIKTVDGWCECP